MKTSVLELERSPVGVAKLPPANRVPPPTHCGIHCLFDYLDKLNGRLQSPTARRALALIRDEPTSFVSVGQWAEKLGISREHLTRTLSPIITPHALMLAVRLALAMQRLAHQTDPRAGEALQIMGYSSRAHAFTVFRLSTGMTPTEWWRRYSQPAPGVKVCLAHNCLFQPEKMEARAEMQGAVDPDLARVG
jgi:AraC-like DNA-binding protein